MSKTKPPFVPSITKGNFVFTSGQIHLTEDGTLLKETIEEQTKQVMNNLEKVLKQAGVGFKDVVKTTIYTTDMSFYGRINNIYRKYFSEPYPAREMVCVKALPLGARVEISMIAFKA